MKYNQLAWLSFVFLLFACGAKTGGGTGTDSSTHWLVRCSSNAACGSLSCICGVCSTECSGNGSCDAPASNQAGVCAAAACQTEQQPAQASGYCSTACQQDSNCPNGLTCNQGVCIATAACAAGTSCTSAPGNSSSPMDVPLTPLGIEVALADFLNTFGSAMCERDLGCRQGASQDRQLLAGTLARCTELASWSPRPMLDARVQATKDGRLRYDAKAATLCLRKLAGSCEAYGTDPAESILDTLCPDLFDGKASLGGACDEDVDCQGDAYCETVGGETGACLRTCKARPALGEVCDYGPCSNAGEPWPLVCADQVAEPGVRRCIAPSITRDLQMGAECGPINRGGETLEGVRACASGLVCARRNSATETCELPLPLGEKCYEYGDVCVEGAWCVPKTNEPESYLCQAFQVQKQAGAACDDVNACDPLARLFCDKASNTCVQSGDGKLGAVCHMELERLACKADLYCTQQTAASSGLCQPLRQLGEACENRIQCRSNTCSAGSCAEPEAMACE